jgi:subtilisin family serine protease
VVNISLGWDLAVLPEAERVLARNTFRDVFEAYPDVLFVTSAGNGDVPEDLSRGIGKQLSLGDTLHAPGGIGGSNNLTVAATNPSGTALAPWSNYGSAVDIAAPGQDIYTTDRDGSYVWRLEGTSYAAALVSGAAAVVRAIDPKLTPQDVKDILLSSPTRVEAPDGAMIPVLDFADAVQRALESHKERSRSTLWWSVGAGLGALALGLLVLRPF